jgi:hypothetical protein
VFVRVLLSAVMDLISVTCSFIGGNVHEKLLQTVMVIIKMKKYLRDMSPSKISIFDLCLWIQERT